MYYTVIKPSHLRTLEKCRKHSPEARAFHISLVFSNACRVLSQCNTQLRLLYLLIKGLAAKSSKTRVAVYRNQMVWSLEHDWSHEAIILGMEKSTLYEAHKTYSLSAFSTHYCYKRAKFTRPQTKSHHVKNLQRNYNIL